MFDAEEREIEDHFVKLWLKELKKVAYDAEDVLSEYWYEVTRVQVEARKTSEPSSSHKRKQMEYIVPISHSMADRLNKIRSRFDEIAKDREALQLRESDGERRRSNKFLQHPTGHMVDEASIFGREVQIKEVVDLLLIEKDKSLSVVSIVGKGGIGKTTIAQLVYKDHRVTQSFDLLGWVCVSEEFDVKRLTKATIESISREINYGLSELSPLQEELAKTVKGKKILLVLDDIWNKNQSLWELFQVPFKEAKMVKVLVTTRNENVAKVMQTTACIWPTNLPDDLCWKLFQHYAFNGTNDNMPAHLVNIGREIMGKCGGLPLALKSIASALRHEKDEEGWRDILESNLWELNISNDIFPALQIRYAHLPAHIKPCFLICSMYPKDYLLEKMELIELWISHGYIESKGERRITEIAVEYYEELKERSFLDNFSRFSENCKLHDIIHDLARLNSENEHYSMEINHYSDIRERNIPRETYHLYARGYVEDVSKILQQNLKSLRTFSGDLRFSRNMTICAITKFEALRVLELKGGFANISDFTPELKHLVFLSITSFNLKQLPVSIGLLYNLQTLILHCSSLENLPESIGYLANLQYLNINSSKAKKLPKLFCSLGNLQRLIAPENFLDYVPHVHVNFPTIKTMVAWFRVRTIAWLKDMKDLDGKLCIEGLDNISNLGDAQCANLRNKWKLETLDIWWKSRSYEDCNSTKPELVLRLIREPCEGGLVGAKNAHFYLLECLQPHPNLKKLHLRGYCYATLPGWMSNQFSLRSIQEVSLQWCHKIKSLPFGNLHTLKHLTIVACSSIQVLPLEHLPSQLEKIKILWCEHLKLITGIGDLKMLATLEISHCEALKSLMMDGLQLAEHTKPFGDSSHETPHINRHRNSSLTSLQIEHCHLLLALPDELIPLEPCYVRVRGCGCPGIEIGILQ